MFVFLYILEAFISSYSSAQFPITSKNCLFPGDKLLPGQSLVSADGQYSFNVQSDGHVCVNPFNL